MKDERATLLLDLHSRGPLDLRPQLPSRNVGGSSMHPPVASWKWRVERSEGHPRMKVVLGLHLALIRATAIAHSLPTICTLVMCVRGGGLQSRSDVGFPHSPLVLLVSPALVSLKVEPFTVLVLAPNASVEITMVGC